MGDFQNNFIREARETHGLGLAGPKADLIQLGEFDNYGFSNAGAEQLGDIVSDVKLLISRMRQADKSNAAIIGEAALFRCDDFRNFGVGDAERLQGLNRGEAEANTVERNGVCGHHAMASRDGEKSGKHGREKV